MENSESYIQSIENKSLFDSFIYQFENQTELGLVILKTSFENDFYANILLLKGYKNIINSSDAALALTAGSKVLFDLNSNFDKTRYDLVGQYANSPGLIQVVNQETFKAELFEVDIDQAKLLLVATEESLRNIEKTYPLRDKAGLIFRF